MQSYSGMVVVQERRLFDEFPLDRLKRGTRQNSGLPVPTSVAQWRERIGGHAYVGRTPALALLPCDMR